MASGGSTAVSHGKPSAQKYWAQNGICVWTYVGDLSTIPDADAVVTREDSKLKGKSFITQTLLNISPMDFGQKRHDMEQKFAKKRPKLWSAHTTHLEPPSPFKHVFHAVMGSDKSHGIVRKMKKMYKLTLKKAKKYQVNVLVMPVLGTGRAGLGVCEAVQAIVESIADRQDKGSLETIYLLTLDKEIAEKLATQCQLTFTSAYRPQHRFSFPATFKRKKRPWPLVKRNSTYHEPVRSKDDMDVPNNRPHNFNFHSLPRNKHDNGSRMSRSISEPRRLNRERFADDRDRQQNDRGPTRYHDKHDDREYRSHGERSTEMGGKQDKREDNFEGHEPTTKEIPPEMNPLNQSVSTNCPICIEPITDPKKLDKCGHVFCRKCIEKYKPVCPSCGMVYGVVTGNMPEGSMNVDFSGEHLPGYENHGTITINYHFQNGIQQDNHPNPGYPYRGTRRIAYLPDCGEGRVVLKLLKAAFDRKLTFTIGRSTATGHDNVVIWNDIHHKTQQHGGTQRYGYPDHAYLGRVKEELASKGVTEHTVDYAPVERNSVNHEPVRSKYDMDLPNNYGFESQSSIRNLQSIRDILPREGMEKRVRFERGTNAQDIADVIDVNKQHPTPVTALAAPIQDDDVFTCQNQYGLTVEIRFGDITDQTADAIVVPEGISFNNLGYVGRRMIEMIPEFGPKREKLKKEKEPFKLWDVYTSECKSKGENFGFILHTVVSPPGKNVEEEDWRDQMMLLYKRVFEQVDRNTLSDMVVPLLGSGRGGGNSEVAINAAVLSAANFNPGFGSLKRIIFVSNDKSIVHVFGQALTVLGEADACRMSPLHMYFAHPVPQHLQL